MNAEEFKQWFAGFFDADGSVYIPIKEGRGVLCVGVSQSEKAVLDEINSFYGGIFRFYTNNRDSKNRIEFFIRVCGKKCLPVLEDLEKYSVLKKAQVCKAIEYTKYIGRPNKGTERQEIAEEISYMNNNTLEFQNKKPYEDINHIYLAGLFDGDGSIGIYTRGARAKITQKNYPAMLEYISNMYPGSIFDEYAVFFNKSDCLFHFLMDVKDYCIYKKDQVLKTIEWLSTDNETIKKRLNTEVRFLKTIDIDLDEYKKYIENVFIDLYDNYTTEELILYNKYEQIKNLPMENFYTKQVYNETGRLKETMNMDIELVFCEDKITNKIWKYYRNIFSSLDERGSIGRYIRILVKDAVSQKFIGIMSLSSDFYALGPRDEYVKKNGYEENIFERNTANLSTCVPLQPFGWNCNGGKLLTMLAFSKEVKRYWEKKYGDPLIGITTTSINGKSVQYDRLKELKYLGLTKGYSVYHLPREVVDLCMMLFRCLKLNCKRISNVDVISELFKVLKINNKYLYHHKYKGIYFGFCDKEPRTTGEITEEWYNRWCKKRVQTHEKHDFQLYTVDSQVFKYLKKYKIIPFTHKIETHVIVQREEYQPITQTKQKQLPFLSKEHYYFIIPYKNTVSTANMVKILKEKFPGIQRVDRNYISKFWQGLIPVPEYLQEDDKYKTMLSIQKKRVYRAEKSDKWKKEIKEANRKPRQT